jgi:hypothetical protein
MQVSFSFCSCGLNAADDGQIGSCTDFGTVSKGDIIYGEASFDSVKHAAPKGPNGKLLNFMGNMRVYVGPI